MGAFRWYWLVMLGVIKTSGSWDLGTNFGHSNKNKGSPDWTLQTPPTAVRWLWSCSYALGRTGSEWWTSLWDQPRERRGGIAKRDEDKLSKQLKGNVMLISPHNVMWFERSPGQDLCSWVHPDFQSPEHDEWAALNSWEVTKRARDQTEWMCLGFKLPSVLLFLLRTTWHPHSQTQLLGVFL